MKKKIILILTTILLLTSLAGCGEKTTSDNTTSTPKPASTTEIEETVENEDISKSSDEYYPFIKKEGEYTYLTVTPQEFIENYNKVIVGKGENGKTWDISLNDFELITRASFNGRQTSFYACPLTIFGRNNGIMITLEVYDDDNTIAAVQLGIKDYYVYDSDVNQDTIDGFYAQYAYLMSGLGLSSDETVDILYNLDYNENHYKNYSLYKKGLAFGFLRDNNDTGWYKIFPCTEDMAEKYGYGDVISE